MSISCDSVDLTASRGFGNVVDGFTFGEVELRNLAGRLLGDGFGEECALGQVNVGFGHLFIFVLCFNPSITSQLLWYNSRRGYRVVKVHL